jgi:long-chain acyl-CoA synthetase
LSGGQVVAGSNPAVPTKKEMVTVEKIWLKSYPAGVPAEINPDTYHSLVEVFDQSFRLYADLPAFYNLGTTITYRQLDAYSQAFAAYLQNELKLKKGDRIAIMLPNILQYPVALFGALRAGLTVVNVNPLYTAPELIHQLNDSGAETIVVLSSFAATVQKALPQVSLKHIIVTNLGDMFPFLKGLLTQFVLKYIKKKIPAWHIPHAIKFKQMMSAGAKLKFSPVDVSSQDIAFLQYTGGTTGVSKGAILTHRNIVANILQARAWFQSKIVPKKEIIITALPLYHIFSLTANCMYFSSIGGLNVLISNPRDIPQMLSEIGKFKFTTLTGVNTLFNGLLKNPAFAKLDFSGLKLSLGGGMAVQRIVAEKWQEITGHALLEAYGLTETSPCVSMNPLSTKGYNGTVGLPVSSTIVAVLDDDGHELSIGMPGELAIKGPQVMRGYWNNVKETEKVFKNGWLLTGDIASVDEKGYIRILERKKDMILVSGFNVYPNEIEDALVTIPGVVEAAVVGVPDESSGEAVKALLVKDDPDLTSADVIECCRKMLTGYKIPKYVEFRQELPKTNVGKILRRTLRA